MQAKNSPQTRGMRRTALALALISVVAHADDSVPAHARSWELRWPRVLPCTRFAQAGVDHATEVDWEWRGDSGTSPLKIHYKRAGETTAIALTPLLEAGALHA